MIKTVDTITAKIYLGLKEGYTCEVHTLDEVKDFLQEYVNTHGLCVTVTPTNFIYTNGREDGVVIGLINYPRFPKTKEEIRRTSEEIAELCKDRFGQKRLSIEYQDQTIMFE